ncbi:MAG: bi-domain-containing oxidoreductase, partial [Anaerolineales bacterium]
MKQVVQNIRTGSTEVMDVPIPVPRLGQVLVKTTASLVSAGTERMVVDFAEKNLVEKARSRPDLAQQFLEKARREGILSTLEMAFNRLDQPMRLGYSSAGVIVKLGEGINDLEIGQRVACGGGNYAVHAEYAVIPRNLLAPIPQNVDDESAAFATIGAIALHAFRLTEVEVGETIAIIGLGLVGFLAAKIANAAGCQVVGIEINPQRLSLAHQMGFVADIPEKAQELKASFTGGKGFDAILIAADTPSNEPVELAAAIARDRAKVVAAGAVGQNLPRKLYYEKELQFINSRSYGPGRYDPSYEEKGVDYPIGYVRWTEGRNLAAFVQMLATQKVDVKSLITHRFPLDQAEKAYHLISGKTGESFLGVVFQYVSQESKGLSEFPELNKVILHPPVKTDKQVKVGVLGAGNYASLVMLPIMQKGKLAEFVAVASASGVSARFMADKYHFQYATSQTETLYQDETINTLVILTRHHLHAQQVIQAIKTRKHIFCEKPLVIKQAELVEVIDTLREHGFFPTDYSSVDKVIEYQRKLPILMVGFNRRFAPLMMELKDFFRPLYQPAFIHYRINAGSIPANHWLNDPLQGGGRLIGEVCHFVDILTYLTDKLPETVAAFQLEDENFQPQENIHLVFHYPNGSVGTISYLANGDKSFPKERLEVFSGGKIGVLEDFRRLELMGNG